MDLRRILRNMRYAQMEQTDHPKTGQRMVPPSIKFAAFVLLVVLLGGLLVWVGSQTPAAGDAGTPLENPPATGGGDNNTTAGSPEAPSSNSGQPNVRARSPLALALRDVE